MVKAASKVNHVPYSVLLNYWRKRFSVIKYSGLYCLIMVEEISSVTLVLLELSKCCQLMLLIVIIMKTS